MSDGPDWREAEAEQARRPASNGFSWDRMHERRARDSSRIVKECSSCHATFTREGWGRAQYVGVQDDPLFSSELRLCSCGSTLAVVFGMSEEGRAKAVDALCDEQDALMRARRDLERKREWSAAEDVNDEIEILNERIMELET